MSREKHQSMSLKIKKGKLKRTWKKPVEEVSVKVG